MECKKIAHPDHAIALSGSVLVPFFSPLSDKTPMFATGQVISYCSGLKVLSESGRAHKQPFRKQHADMCVRFPGNERLLVASVGIFTGFSQDFIHDPPRVSGMFLLI